ncbi:MAG: hypothetical protein CMJ48_11195 [Planctomycetaceae bacterium]|nr:hypothetical protein [Planctomycetaceae bacterium]
MLKRLITLKYKLSALVILPLVGIVILGAQIYLKSTHDSSEMADLQQLTQLAGKISALVHESQKERGATAVFIDSKGQKFAAELPAQRQDSDKRIAELTTFLDTFDAARFPDEFQNSLKAATGMLDEIGAKRKAVSDLNIPAAEAIGYYTTMNGEFLKTTAATSTISSDSQMSQRIACYVELLQGKERAGVERAVLASTFAADKFGPGVYGRFVSLAGQQTGHFNTFKANSSAEDAAFFDSAMSDPIVKEFQRMRTVARSKGADSARANLVHSLTTDFGYGGAIHLFKNFVLRHTPKYEERFTKTYEQMSSTIEQLNALGDLSDSERANIAVVKETLDAYRDGTALASAMVADGKSVKEIDAAVKVNDGPALKALDELYAASTGRFGVDPKHWFTVATKRIDLLKTVENHLTDGLLENAETVKAAADARMQFAAATVLGMLVLGAVAGWLVIRSIRKPLVQMVNVARHVAAGDLNHDISYSSQDEIGELADSFGEVVSSLKGLNTEMGGLVQSSRDGDLSKRGEAARFEGAYRELIDGTNSMLEAIASPMTEATDVFSSIAGGDLTSTMQGTYKGEFRRLSDSVNTTVDNLNSTLGNVTATGHQVASSTSQVRGNSMSLAEGATEQASALQEVAASLEEMSAMTGQCADNANQAKLLAEETQRSSANGNDSMQKMAEAIDRIKANSDEQAKIVKTIDEIAFQTNLLALNAAVEAARAGDAGKGFAVVAEEVRNLAQRSAEAARTTARMIEESVNNAENGVAITAEVAEVLGEIREGADKTNDLVAEIAAATGEQAQGIEQVNTAITQLDQVTQESASNSQDSANVAESLNQQVDELAQMVAEFTLRDADPASSRTARTNGHHRSASKPAKAAAKTPPAKTNGHGTAVNGSEQAMRLVPFDDGESGFGDF